MDGILLYVMGPSGAGKDSLIRQARQDLEGGRPAGRRARFARRYITRFSGCAGEEHYPVSPAGFAALKSAGEFCMDWQSHGLCYGIGREVEEWLRQGDLVVVNGSRAYLPQAEKLFPCLAPVLVRARAEVLRQRLESRGRESAAEIEERLSLAAWAQESGRAVIEIDNSASLEEARREFRRVLAGFGCGALSGCRPGIKTDLLAQAR
ncbi:MAG: phosphonate metabolism protein/1,5-bisphosphokinase (PRPP-forming) PhnN [Deltaproteobacteria bacterium]|jgi:ribose 1,5-bisphosphokinase|nr:phosphonate metabolism protein/1,5-bisphosphokinase (PRPP-forming) PhnN [Deltaproteobacteria bacterium]